MSKILVFCQFLLTFQLAFANASGITAFRTGDTLAVTTPEFSYIKHFTRQDPRSASIQIWNKKIHIRKMGFFRNRYLFIEITAKTNGHFVRAFFKLDPRSLDYKLLRTQKVISPIFLYSGCLPESKAPTTAQLSEFARMLSKYQAGKLEDDLQQSALLKHPSCQSPAIDSQQQKSFVSAFAKIVASGSANSNTFIKCVQKKLGDSETSAKLRATIAKLKTGEGLSHIECQSKPGETASCDTSAGILNFKIPKVEGNALPNEIFHELLHEVLGPNFGLDVTEKEVAGITSCCGLDPIEANCQQGSAAEREHRMLLSKLDNEPGLVKILGIVKGNTPATESLNALTKILVDRLSIWRTQNLARSECADAKTANSCLDSINSEYWKLQEVLGKELCESIGATSTAGCFSISTADKLPFKYNTKTVMHGTLAIASVGDQSRQNVSQVVAQLPNTQSPTVIPIITQRGPAAEESDQYGAIRLDPNHPVMATITREADLGWAQKALTVVSNEGLIPSAVAQLPTVASGSISSTNYFLPVGQVPLASSVSLPASPRQLVVPDLKLSAANGKFESAVSSSIGSGIGLSGGASSGGGPSLGSSLSAGNTNTGALGVSGDANGSAGASGTRATASDDVARGAASRSGRAVSTGPVGETGAGDDGLGVSGTAGGSGASDIGGGSATNSGGGTLVKRSSGAGVGSSVDPIKVLPKPVSRYLSRSGKKVVPVLKAREPDFLARLREQGVKLIYGNNAYGSSTPKMSYQVNEDGTLTRIEGNSR